jgi:methionyl-tRNA formyltransferase
MSSRTARPRILLIGSGPTTRSALAGLMGAFEVVALVRDGADDVVATAGDAGIPVVPARGPGELPELVTRFAPDCVVVSSYDRILSEGVLSLCPFVNVHYSPLPRYRGRANVNWAIVNREAEAAVTVHTIVPGLDAGGVLAQELVPIRPRDTVGSLYERLNAVQERLLPQAVTRRLAGDVGTTQDESRATYGCTRLPEDGEIDWSASTADIDALVRSLGPPYPDAFTFLGLDRVGILEAGPSPDPRVFVGRVGGRVVAWSRDEGWADVLTGDGILRVTRVRRGNLEHTAASVLGSSRVTLGLRTAHLLARVEELTARLAQLGESPPEA